MTAPGSTPGRAWHGGLAFLLSVLVHGLVVVACMLSPGRARHAGAGLFVEQRVKDDGPILGLFLADQPAPAEPSLLATSPTAHSENERPPPAAPAVIPELEGPPPPVSRPRESGPPTAVASGLTRASSASPPGSAGVSNAFFEIPARGQSVVFVLDRSASMGQSRAFGVARRELLAGLDRLPATTRFQVIVYNRIAEVLRIAGQADLVPATPENRREAARLLHGLTTEGGTEHLPALQRALVLQADVIYFLTDAHDLKAEHARMVTRLNRGRSVIHAVVLGREQADSTLRVLAKENRGEYRAVTGAP